MSAFLHGRGLHAQIIEPSLATDGISNDKDSAFQRLRIDSCASRTSVIGLSQYRAYCRNLNLLPCIRTSGNRTIKGIGGTQKSIGAILRQIPFTGLIAIIDVSFLVLGKHISTLLSMKDMLENGLDIAIQGQYVSLGKRRHPLIMEDYFLIHNWKPADVPHVFYTEQELRTLHRTFDHQSARALQSVLKKATGSKVDKYTDNSVERIKTNCTVCKQIDSATRQFKLTVGTSELRFNHRVQVDTMFIHGRPVIHMVDEATHFCASSFLKNKTTKEIWKQIQHMCSLIYLGHPDHLIVDQVTTYTSKEMKESAIAHGIKLEDAPTETPGAFAMVERYHAPLSPSYEKIRGDTDRDTSDQECLDLAVFAINCTIGPEGLCPTLLVFGAIPCPARATPALTQLKLARLIDVAMKDVEREQARRRISFGLRHKGGQKGKEASLSLHQLPAEAPLLVYRASSKQWEGPFKIINIEGETVVMQLNQGRKIFRSSCAKPVNESMLGDNISLETGKELESLQSLGNLKNIDTETDAFMTATEREIPKEKNFKKKMAAQKKSQEVTKSRAE